MSIFNRKRKDTININNQETAKKSNLSKAFRRELILTAFSIIGVTLVLLGSSYGAFSQIIKSENANVLKTGDLAIEFNDTDTGLGNIISLNQAYPESDEKGKNNTPYSFKIENTGTLPANYEIRIIDDMDMINEDKCAENLLDKKFIKYSFDQQTPAFLSSVSDKDFVIETGTLDVGASETHTINMWIDENADNNVIGKHYHGKIVITAK